EQRRWTSQLPAEVRDQGLARGSKAHARRVSMGTLRPAGPCIRRQRRTAGEDPAECRADLRSGVALRQGTWVPTPSFKHGAKNDAHARANRPTKEGHSRGEKSVILQTSIRWTMTL